MIIQTGEQHNGKVAKRTHVMAKPNGSKCNLDCDYCYYLSKEDLLEYRKGCSPEMNVETLEAYIKSYNKSLGSPS